MSIHLVFGRDLCLQPDLKSSHPGSVRNHVNKGAFSNNGRYSFGVRVNMSKILTGKVDQLLGASQDGEGESVSNLSLLFLYRPNFLNIFTKFLPVPNSNLICNPYNKT